MRAITLLLFVGSAAGALAQEPATSLGRISYSTFRPPSWDLYLFEGDRGPLAITEHPALDYGAAVSPDGRWLVFTSERDGGPDLWAKNLETLSAPVKLIESPAMEDQAAFSPTGEDIVFVGTAGGTADLYRLPFDPKTTHSLSAAERLTDHSRAELRPVYHPDGRTIIFTGNHHALDKGHASFPFAIMTSGDLYALDIASGRVDRLTDSDAWEGSAAFAPDGTTLYFYSEEDATFPRLHRMGPDDLEPVLVVADELAVSPAPFADGSVLYVSQPQESEPPSWMVRKFTQDGLLEEVPTGDHFCHELVTVPKRNAFICQGVSRDYYDKPSKAGDFAGPILAKGFPRRQAVGDSEVDLFAFAHAFSVPLNPNKYEIARLGEDRFSLAIQDPEKGEMTEIVNFSEDAKALKEARRGIMGISFSASGDRLAFSLKGFRRNAIDGDVYIVEVNGNSVRNVTNGRVAAAGMPDFGDSDGKVVFAGRDGQTTDLFSANLDGSQLRNITNTPEIRENFPTLSDDGRHLAFASDRDGLLDESSGERTMDIYLGELDASGDIQNIRKVTDGPGQKAHARFSPDGRWLVYTSGKGGINDEYLPLRLVVFTPQLYGEIYAYRLEDGLTLRLTHDKWEDGAPFWVSSLPSSED